MKKRGFTLVELLVTITIIGILAAVLLGVLAMSAEKARDTRTRLIILRLNRAITSRWESYPTRRIPIDPGAVAAANGNFGFNPNSTQATMTARLLAMRELQRLELPQRWDDVTSDATAHPTAPEVATAFLDGVPALSHSYLQQFNASKTAPSPTHEAAECLYLIITMGAVGADAESPTSFRPNDVGDTDEDGMNEFLDGWGNPISWLRWAPGFVSELQPMMTDNPATAFDESVLRDSLNNHDPFDMLKIDMPPAATPPETGFRLPNRGWRMFPLIYSAGPDEQLDIARAVTPIAPDTDPPYNDPYAGGTNTNFYGSNPMTLLPGEAYDGFQDGLSNLDNIHNHARR